MLVTITAMISLWTSTVSPLFMDVRQAMAAMVLLKGISHCFRLMENSVKKGGRLISVSTDSSFNIDNAIINIDGEFEEDVKMEGLTNIQEVCCAAKNPRFY